MGWQPHYTHINELSSRHILSLGWHDKGNYASVHHRQLSSKSNSGGGLFLWFWYKFWNGNIPSPVCTSTRPDHLPIHWGDLISVCLTQLWLPSSPVLTIPGGFSFTLSLQGCSAACKMDLRRDRLIQLICFSFFVPVSFEFGRAVWLRFHPSAYPPCPHPSFMAHLGGVMVGITLGVVILRNYEQRLQDQTLWWIFLSIYLIFVLFAIFWNIFAYSLLDLKLPPPP